MSDTIIQPSTGDARQKIALAAGIALLTAGVLLVTVVLPSEYAVDPLGVGRRLGLVELGEVGEQVNALEGAKASAGSPAVIIAPQDTKFNSETVEFRLEPKGSIEYKYRLDKGKSLLFSWTATGIVNYEFHAEPDGAPRGYAQSYEKSTGTTKSGTLTAPFAGIHGWYWENSTDQAVTVTLLSAGFYNLAHEFHTDGSVRNKSFP